MDNSAEAPEIIPMQTRYLQSYIQLAGILITLLYGAFVLWIYVTAPRTFREAATNTSVITGSYTVDQNHFNAGVDLFHRAQYRAAREELKLADPASRDATTQFYIAYSFYREGWGRAYNDKALFTEGQRAANRAIELAPGGSVSVSDPDLKLHSATELKAELEQGLEGGWGDLNPLKVFRERK
jgi:hypothetical protein